MKKNDNDSEEFEGLDKNSLDDLKWHLKLKITQSRF